MKMFNLRGLQSSVLVSATAAAAAAVAAAAARPAGTCSAARLVTADVSGSTQTYPKHCIKPRLYVVMARHIQDRT